MHCTFIFQYLQVFFSIKCNSCFIGILYYSKVTITLRNIIIYLVLARIYLLGFCLFNVTYSNTIHILDNCYTNFKLFTLLSILTEDTISLNEGFVPLHVSKTFSFKIKEFFESLYSFRLNFILHPYVKPTCFLYFSYVSLKYMQK